MRIALVHRLLTHQGGVEKNVMVLAEGLVRRGHEVTAIVSEVRDAAPPGVKVEVVSARGFSRAGRYLAFDRAAALAVANHRFDLVQGFDFTTRQDVLRVGRGVKRVYDDILDRTRGPFDRLIHALSPNDRAISRLEEQVFSPTSWKRLVTNCMVVKQELVDAYRIDPAVIEVIHNGVNVEEFEPQKARAGRDAVRARFGIGPADHLVLHVGSGFRRKGVDTTIKAVALLSRRDPRVKLVVVGRDGATRRYRRIARSLGIGDRVQFPGPMRTDAALYGAADVVSLASRYEPFGNVVLEALACGVPAVHGKAGGASEVLMMEGLSELVVEDATDAEGQAAKLEAALAAGEPLRERCRAAAMRHRLSDMVDSYDALYKRLAS